jgi:hypothetical protein
MASRYNGRQTPVEVFVRDGKIVGKTERATPESWAEERAKAGAALEDDSERKTVVDLERSPVS